MGSCCTSGDHSMEPPNDINLRIQKAPKVMYVHKMERKQSFKQPKACKVGRYFFVIRHGQRADQTEKYKSERGNPDPFLTPIGHK